MNPDTSDMTRKVLTPEIRERAIQRVREVLDHATKLWPEHKAKFQDSPTIRFDVKSRVGGMAITGGADDWTVRLNPILCFENEDHFMTQTVGHEVAHLVTRVVHGNVKTVEENGKQVIKKVRSHGKEWKSVMVALGLKPETYHTYDTSSIEGGKRRRSRPGAVLAGMQNLEMLRRLQTGFNRLEPQAKKEFMQWARAQ